MTDTALTIRFAPSLLMTIKLRQVVTLSVNASTVAAALDLQVTRIVAPDEPFGLAFAMPTPAAFSRSCGCLILLLRRVDFRIDSER